MQKTKESRSGQSLVHKLSDRGIDWLLVLLVPALLVIILLFVYPMFYGVGISVQPQQNEHGMFSNYIRFFTDQFHYATIWKTLALAIPAAFINVGASVPIAMQLRRPFRGKRLLTSLLVLPVTLGTVMVASGMLRFFAPSGWFNQILMGLGLADEPVRLIYNYTGVLISLIITGFPFAFLLTLSYLSGIDESLEKAASTLGANRAQQIRYVVIPLLMPGLAMTFCLTFVLAFGVFPSANLVGEPTGSTRVLSIAAYQAAFEQYDFTFSSAIAVIMGLIELVIVGFVLWVRSFWYEGSTSGGKG